MQMFKKLKKNHIFYIILLSILFFSSCAKVRYLAEQGIGQVSLLTKAKKNTEVLKDVRVSKKDKEKIKSINTYKSYFYKYWGKKKTSIYSKTTFLESKAVSYLVIASPFRTIKAKEECFPLMGCFPYLGFYKLDSAKSHAKRLEEDNYVTYIRPVYAYSTLGYFTDTILSSFFYYNEFDLCELIFHELFHTIFFIKDEVQLNENLANYFGKEMAMEYFDFDEKTQQKMEKDKKDEEGLNLLIVKLTKNLNKRYSVEVPKTKQEANDIFTKWKSSEFDVEVNRYCKNNKIIDKDCYPKHRKWNNASLAAFLTYEKDAQKLSKLKKKLGLDLKGFYFHIEKMYNRFKKEGEGDFSSYLFRSLSH